MFFPSLCISVVFVRSGCASPNEKATLAESKTYVWHAFLRQMQFKFDAASFTRIHEIDVCFLGKETKRKMKESGGRPNKSAIMSNDKRISVYKYIIFQRIRCNREHKFNYRLYLKLVKSVYGICIGDMQLQCSMFSPIIFAYTYRLKSLTKWIFVCYSH